MIDDMKFPLEVHLVHKSQTNKLAVVGFLFRISDQANNNLNKLLTGVQDLVFEDRMLII